MHRSGRDASCDAIVCESLMALGNGEIFYSHHREYDSSVTFTCDQVSPLTYPPYSVLPASSTSLPGPTRTIRLQYLVKKKLPEHTVIFESSLQ